jgi:NAD(P)-dependent dehydrogenase (short-subunit alcohol dehydrogenase family)
MADEPTLTGARVLVVGASAGIGRAFARHAIAQGARVCAAARRREALDELCCEAGGGHAVAADVTDPDACRRLVDEAVGHLGALDLVLHTAGGGGLAPIAEADPDEWRRIYEVNVLGPTLVCGAALPALAPDGLIAFMSSEAATAETRWGMSAYAASKAALDTAIRFWRHENPDRRFQRIVMGATQPTDIADSWDIDRVVTSLEHWKSAGISMAMMETDDVGRQLVEVLGAVLAHPGIDVPDIRLAPRGSAAP